MKKLTLFLGALLLLLSPHLPAQVLTVTPTFPTLDDTVTIVYDATQGNAALVGASPVYAHTGIITTTSSSPSDWKYVVGNWGTADNRVLMTSLGNNKYQIKYHVRTFYAVPAGVVATKLAFVFRNTDGSVVGRDVGGGDIFYDFAAPGGFQVSFLAPAQKGTLTDPGVAVPIQVAASSSVPLTLFQNGTQVAQNTGTSLNYNFSSNTPGKYDFVIEANNSGTLSRDTTSITVRGPVNVQDAPAGVRPGINYINDTTVILALLAPGKQYVYAIGEFSNFYPDPIGYMNKSLNGELWWVSLTGLTPGREYAYQYLVDGSLKVADPFSDKVLDPSNDNFISAATYPNLKPYPNGKTTGIVSVFQTNQAPYGWNDAGFQRPDKKDLVIYELLVRDFSAARNFQTVLDSLDYLQAMGINCIELMPIMEFEGNESWGYNPSFYFAADKYYGGKEALKTLIDSCHNRGIAVVLDMVLNHAFGQCPLVQLYWDAANNQPAANSPWFNQQATHPFSVGYDFNHQSSYTQAFVDRVMRYWVEEYHFDGYRMDLSKGFTQTNYGNDVGAWSNYDQGRINILQRMANALWSYDANAYIILEHFANNSEETVLANFGFMLWSNHVNNYNEATMGYLSNSDFSWISYKNKGWNNPHAVGYMESHDEERLMYKNLTFGNSSGSYNTRSLYTALERQELAGTFFFTVPGPKMLWQFGELGYEVSIDFNGRVGNKPVRWEYLQDARRYKLYRVWSELIKLRTSEPAFGTSDFTMEVGGGVAVKRIKLTHASMNVAIIGNFDVVTQNGTANFQNTGWWYEFFSGDSINVSNTSMNFTLAPGEYRLYTTKRFSKPNVTLSADPGQDFWASSGFPNPFSDQFTIAYDLPATGEVTVQLLDLQGRLIRTLQDNTLQAAGMQDLVWDGKDDQGREVAAGVYLYRVASGQLMATGRAVKN